MMWQNIMQLILIQESYYGLKTNIVPFNSKLKIKDDVFYVVDYKNTLRSISIKDGSEIWNLKTEESLSKIKYSNSQLPR